jgi:uncharacterized protein YjdB
MSNNLPQLTIGATKTLTFFDGSTQLTSTVSFKSLNPNIATVDSSGVVTAVAEGIATIVVSNTTDTTKIHVVFKVNPVTPHPSHNYRVNIPGIGDIV